MALSNIPSASLISPFDQVTVVSQAAVNDRLKELHAKHEILQKFDVRQQDSDDMGLMECVLGPPTVRLAVGPNRQRATYFVHIKVYPRHR